MSYGCGISGILFIFKCNVSTEEVKAENNKNKVILPLKVFNEYSVEGRIIFVFARIRNWEDLIFLIKTLPTE